MADPLAAVKAATDARTRGIQRLDTRWHTAIRAAVDGGQSQAAVARAAGVTRARINQIMRNREEEQG
jgi:predicted XRE-type DNA-binding protein